MSSTSYGSDGRQAIDRIADALSAVGRHVKATRSGGHIHLQASCPVHGADRNPSLSVDQYSGERRARMYCHSCADSVDEREMAEAIGLRYDELWDEPAGEYVRCHKRTIMLPVTGGLIHPRCADTRAERPVQSRAMQGSGAVTSLLASKPHPVRPGPLPDRLTKDWPQQRKASRFHNVPLYEHDDLEGTVLDREVIRGWNQFRGSRACRQSSCRPT